MLKFQVTAAGAASPSRCSTASPQRLSRVPSPAQSAADAQSVDRSIDELEEYITQQATVETPPLTRPANVADECSVVAAAAAVNAARCCPSPSPSLPDLSPSPCSSSSSSLNSTMDRRKSAVPMPPTCKRMTSELGYLRVYTAQIKTDTDYKTLRVASVASTECVIRQLVLDKLRLSLRDLNLFHLFMEVRTRRMDGTEARTILELDRMARPLELQKCHPIGMSRFILGMDSNAILARIYDGEVNPESNYKSVLVSRRTCCAEVLQMLCQMCRLHTAGNFCLGLPRAVGVHSPSKSVHHQHQLGLEAISELRLFVDGPRGAEPALIPAKCPLAGVQLALLPSQRIVLRRVIVPKVDGFL